MEVSEWVRHVVSLETRMPVEVEAGPEVTIEADAAQLEQLLINLVRNAIALTEQGGIRVNVKMVGGVGPSGGRICFEVCDTGPGLTELERQRLFEPVDQADPSSGRRLGTTLGMLVSRGLAELLGGLVGGHNPRENRLIIESMKQLINPSETVLSVIRRRKVISPPSGCQSLLLESEVPATL